MPKPRHFITERLPDPADGHPQFWRHVLMRDMELYQHAKTMLCRSKNTASSYVIITAMQNLRGSVCEAIEILGGLMGEW